MSQERIYTVDTCETVYIFYAKLKNGNENLIVCKDMGGQYV